MPVAAGRRRWALLAGVSLGAVAIAGRKEWPVTALTGRRGTLGRSTLAVDTRYLYFAWEEGHGDIWVAEIGPPPGR